MLFKFIALSCSSLWPNCGCFAVFICPYLVPWSGERNHYHLCTVVAAIPKLLGTQSKLELSTTMAISAGQLTVVWVEPLTNGRKGPAAWCAAYWHNNY